MKRDDYQRLFHTLKPHLWQPVLLLYGRYSEKVVSAKKILDAAGIQYQVRNQDTERIGGPGAPVTIPVPGKKSIDPAGLPDVHEITFYVKGNDVARAKRLLAKLEEKPTVSIWRWVFRICGVLLFVFGYITLPLLKYADIWMFMGLCVFGASFIKRKSKFEPGKYTFVTCPICKKINHVELDRFEQALCGGCKVKLSKVLDAPKF